MEGKRIYFVTLRFDRQIHGGPLGFTDTYYTFAWGADSQEAQTRASQHYESKYDLKVIKTGASLAEKQDPAKYVFPEHIK
jgi:hypothetical protein